MLAFLQSVDAGRGAVAERSDTWYDPVIAKLAAAGVCLCMPVRGATPVVCLRCAGFNHPFEMEEGSARSLVDTDASPPLLGAYPAFLGRAFRKATEMGRAAGVRVPLFMLSLLSV